MNKTIITPPKRFSFPNFKEVYKYRELFFTLVKRDITVRYKQTVIGASWAIIQPFTQMVIFSFFFGKLAQIPSDGVPYPIFSYSGLLLWTYFSSALNSASNSLVGSAGLITKVYFPRLIIPLSATMVGIVDYLIASTIVVGLMIYFQFMPGLQILLIPIVLFFTWMLASGIGFWFSATNVLIRDVRYVISFVLQLWIYATPVIYPASVAGQFKWIVMLNPMTGLIEAHRAMVLGHQAIPWGALSFSVVSTLVIFVTGLIYFRSIERRFADVI